MKCSCSAKVGYSVGGDDSAAVATVVSVDCLSTTFIVAV